MKETYYFPHDSNAIQDPKMITLLNECGLFGIGAFWVVIEILHQQQRGAIGVAELKSCLSFYGKQGAWDETLINKTEKALFDTKLLIIEDGLVYSGRVINNLKKRDELSKGGRENALKRWAANAKPLATHRQPNAKKERKGKERKEKEGTLLLPEDLEENRVEIEEWLGYKKEKRQAYKPIGLKALFNSIRDIPKGKRRSAIEYSMSQNWQGIFEKKESKEIQSLSWVEKNLEEIKKREAQIEQS